MKEKEIYYNMWELLDNLRDYAYLLNDEEDIKILSQLRRKYLNLSGIGNKVIKQIENKLN